MKIFPIREVRSEDELSSRLSTAGASAAAVATVGVGGSLAGTVRSTSLSASGGTTGTSAAGCASTGLSAAACRISLARVDMALALPSGVSADASFALALATDGGIALETPPSSAAASVASAFPARDDFSATLPELRCACLFKWREPCLAYFLTATNSSAPRPDSVLADFESVTALSSAPAATGDGPAKHAKSPVASINTGRALVLMVIYNLSTDQPRKSE